MSVVNVEIRESGSSVVLKREDAKTLSSEDGLNGHCWETTSSSFGPNIRLFALWSELNVEIRSERLP